MADLVRRVMEDPYKLGDTLATSGFFSDARGEAQALVKVIAGAELGIGPLASMTGIHVIEGKISIGATLLAAKVRESGRYRYRVLEHTDEKCSIEFLERVGDAWESCGPPSEFTIADADRASLRNKHN